MPWHLRSGDNTAAVGAQRPWQKEILGDHGSQGGACCAVASSSIPPAAAPGPELATRVMGPPSSRQERIAPGAAPIKAPAPSPAIRSLGPAVTSAASVPIVVRTHASPTQHTEGFSGPKSDVLSCIHVAHQTSTHVANVGSPPSRPIQVPSLRPGHELYEVSCADQSPVVLRLAASQGCPRPMQAPAQAPVTVPVLASLGQAPVSPAGGAVGHTKVWSSASKRVALIAATTQATIAPIAAPGPGPSVAASSVLPVPVRSSPLQI